MSVRYQPVGWNRNKRFYDLVVLAGVVLYILAYQGFGSGTDIDDQSLAIRAWGSCAFLLLTLVLCIGPLARIDRRFLPLLYNRRHIGVMTATVATAHAAHVLGWYFAFSPVPPIAALFATDTAFGQIRGFPFIPFGMMALMILWIMAATSHDFWLAFLTPRIWKTMHMLVYPAYALILAHMAFGALQDPRATALPLTVILGAIAVTGLHLASAARARAELRAVAEPGDEAPWVVVGEIDRIAEGRGIVVQIEGAEAVAVFRDGGAFSAISNLCAHQNGPLGEGRVLDGCVTCPWHGYQYRLRDGRAPAPFTERIATYRLALRGNRLLLDPRPNPPGTPVDPVRP